MSRYHRSVCPWVREMRRDIKRAVIRTHGLTCWLCKLPIATFEEATMDHVKKASKGGEYTEENLRPAHKICNNTRHRRAGMITPATDSPGPGSESSEG